MKKINVDKSTLVSIGAVALTGLSALFKLMDDKNKKAAEREEIIQEVVNRISKQD